MSDYMIPAEATFYEQEIKRSRFLTWITHTESPNIARGFVDTIRKQYPDARHVCWAWVAGSPTSQHLAMSDDGEPQGTAGKPMLNVLQYKNIGETTAVVVRYFGGVKLGTGGLSRAYSSSVTEALKTTPLVEKVAMCQVQLGFPYSVENTVRHILKTVDANISAVEHQETVRFHCAVPTKHFFSLKQQLPFTVCFKSLDEL